jgi:hypothetical protein
VIVVSDISSDVTASKELLHSMQHIDAPLTLDDHEDRLGLPTDLACSISVHWNTEAALAVDEADDPLLESWPFLLIGRTGRIVTAHRPTPYEAGATVSEYRRIHGVSSI